MLEFNTLTVIRKHPALDQHDFDHWPSLNIPRLNYFSLLISDTSSPLFHFQTWLNSTPCYQPADSGLCCGVAVGNGERTWRSSAGDWTQFTSVPRRGMRRKTMFQSNYSFKNLEPVMITHKISLLPISTKSWNFGLCKAACPEHH